MLSEIFYATAEKNAFPKSVTFRTALRNSMDVPSQSDGKCRRYSGLFLAQVYAFSLTKWRV